MSTPNTAPQVETAAPMSEVQRVTGVFFEPSKTFADLARKQSWWVPWLLMSILSLAFVYCVQKQIGFDKITETQISKSARADQFDKLPADQKAKQLELATAITKYSTWAVPIWILLGLVVMSAIVMCIYNFGLGGKVAYGRSLAIMAYSSLPTLISTVLAIITVFLVDPDGYDIQKPVASNLGALVDPRAHKALFGILSAFDVFTIWTIILIAIGYEQYTKTKRWTGFAVLFGIFFVVKAAFAGLSLAF